MSIFLLFIQVPCRAKDVTCHCQFAQSQCLISFNFIFCQIFPFISPLTYNGRQSGGVLRVPSMANPEVQYSLDLLVHKNSVADVKNSL